MNDLDTLFNRAFGFEPMLRNMNTVPVDQKFPPCNIASYLNENNDKRFRVDLALAGWLREELEVIVGNNKLTIKGDPKEDEYPDDVDFKWIQHGIAKRGFEWSRVVSDDLIPDNVSFDDGILSVWLDEKVPEHKKIRSLSIGKSELMLENT
jgi:molecular chaperone IbpA